MRPRPLWPIAALLLLAPVPLAAQMNPPSHAGFPKTLTGGGPTPVDQIASQVLVADLKLSSDGTRSILFTTVPDWGSTTPKCGTQGQLHVLRKDSLGSWGEAPGFPVSLGAPSDSSPAVGDLDGDGVPDIVVGYGTACSLSLPGGVKAFKNNGTLLWNATPASLVSGAPSGGVVSTPAIGDINGDGRNEVVFGSFDQFIHVVKGADGTPLGAWPIFIRDTIWSSPVLHDIDGDGLPDVIIGVDAHLEGAPYNTPDGGCLHVLRFDATQDRSSGSNPVFWGPPTEVHGFPQCVDQVIFSAPVVGDIDGDGKPEIVHGTGTYYSGRLKQVYAWKCDGTAVPGWPVAVEGEVSSSPALADLDGDGLVDVVVTTGPNASNNRRLQAFHGSGTAVFAATNVLDCNGVSLSAGPPVVADMFGSTTAPEILVPTNTSVAVFSNAGALLSNSTSCLGSNTFYTPSGLAGVAVQDIDPPPPSPGSDGKIDVVTVSATSNTNPVDTLVNVWNPVSRTSTPPWGLYRQNPPRTGVAPGTLSCKGACSAPPATAINLHTLTPCRLVDTRNATGPYGGPALANAVYRDFDLAGAVASACLSSVPATAKALSLNLTVISPTGSGFVRFSPGCVPPLTSTVSFSAGQTRANNAVLAVDANGILTANAVIAGGGTVQLLIDVNGYFQ